MWYEPILGGIAWGLAIGIVMFFVISGVGAEVVLINYLEKRLKL